MSDFLRAITANIVAAHVAANTVHASELPAMIKTVHAALVGLDAPAAFPAEQQAPAVAVRASVKPDYLVSLESGKRMKMLKRYLMANYGMSPDDYRRKWNLPVDYPMVAPNYADRRREMAKKIGLGKKPVLRSEAPRGAAGRQVAEGG
ncbi:Ros/MucR family transcriptional regulator [Rhizorhabdus argentea]|uniref:MucR family transcriptional regulator n=1 Tax=Rhizorhabdus argentea TaxID=1387174 RepID=UPI0030EFA32F